MDENFSGALRFVVATVALGRASVKDDVAKIVVKEIQDALFNVVRSVTVNREKHFIEQLVMNIATSNQADIVILVGGVGLGPRDYTCEAVDNIADRRIEGFGEAFRHLMHGEGARALLLRATAVVCNKCVVVALPRQPDPLRRAIRELVVPTIRAAAHMASGGSRHSSAPGG
jgi:molybdenum cofactor biosynthesis protein B